MAARDAVKRVPEIARNHCPTSAKCALNVQDVGAQQTGMSVEAFRQMLLDAAHQQEEA